MNLISWIWKMMKSIASYFNTNVFYLPICPTMFISLIGIISLWSLKVQLKEMLEAFILAYYHSYTLQEMCCILTHGYRKWHVEIYFQEYRKKGKNQCLRTTNFFHISN